jgi:hypothetical protein
MSDITLDQGKKLLELTTEHLRDSEDVQFLFESGLYTDLLGFVGNHSLRRRMNLLEVKEAFREALGLNVFPENGKAMFATPEEQLAIFHKINQAHNLGFEDKHFAVLGPTPTENANGLVVWTLEAMLQTGLETFNFLWSLIKDGEGYKIPFGGKCLGVQPVCEWKPMSLRWVKIDLGANQGVEPKVGITPMAAHCGPMWQAIYSPNWFYSISKTVNGLFVPEVSLPGFALRYGEHGGVPHLEPERIRQHAVDISYTNRGVGQAALACYVEGANPKFK